MEQAIPPVPDRFAAISELSGTGGIFSLASNAPSLPCLFPLPMNRFPACEPDFQRGISFIRINVLTILCDDASRSERTRQPCLLFNASESYFRLRASRHTSSLLGGRRIDGMNGFSDS